MISLKLICTFNFLYRIEIKVQVVLIQAEIFRFSLKGFR